MRILVTAGNTQTPLDQVRCITNIFTGQTGTRIARTALDRGHEVCLLTSHPELAKVSSDAADRWNVRSFRTFDDLQSLMAETIPGGGFDAIVHCAAVSDYDVAGVYATSRDGSDKENLPERHPPRLVDVRQGKVKSSHDELWIRLKPTPKLVDRIRRDWGFDGVLAKFKLEVGIGEPELARIATLARRQSEADLIVANTLEGMQDWAMLIDETESTVRVARRDLAGHLIEAMEHCYCQRQTAPAPAFGSFTDVSEIAARPLSLTS